MRWNMATYSNDQPIDRTVRPLIKERWEWGLPSGKKNKSVIPVIHKLPPPKPVTFRRKWYHPLENPPANLSEVKIEMVQRAVINHFDLTLPELKNHRRNAKLVRPRHIAMYLCRELLDRSLLQVGKLFGRDHTTVMHSVAKVSPIAWTDPDVIAIRNQILGDLPVPEADPNQLTLEI